MTRHTFKEGDFAVYFGQSVRVDGFRGGLVLITSLDEDGHDVVDVDAPPQYVMVRDLRPVVTLNVSALDDGAVVG